MMVLRMSDTGSNIPVLAVEEIHKQKPPFMKFTRTYLLAFMIIIGLMAAGLLIYSFIPLRYLV